MKGSERLVVTCGGRFGPWMWAALFSSLVSCGSDGNTAESEPAGCEDGTTAACSCAGGGEGTRECTSGTLGPCECGTPPPPEPTPTVEVTPSPPPEPCFEPCGGSLAGTWFFASTCETDVGFLCASAVDPTPRDVHGELTFAGATVDGVFGGTADTSVTIEPCEELGGAPRNSPECASFEATLRDQPGLSNVDCVYNAPGCTCSYSSTWDATLTAAPLQFPSPTSVLIEQAGGEFDYCVTGDELFLRPITDPNVTDVTYRFRRVVCEPDEPYCDDNIARVCDDVGTGFVSETPCAAGAEVCIGGTCVPTVCPASQRYCEEGSVKECDPTGTVESVVVTCAVEEYCDDSSPACTRRICEPNEPACDGTVLTTCDELGASYAGDRLDCAANSLACTPDLGCRTPGSFTVGSTYQCFDGGTEREFGDRYSVTQPARLVEIEMYLLLAAERTIEFSVYESTIETGSYTRIFSVTTVAPAMPQGGFVSSGPIHVVLDAGHYYWITARSDREFGTCFGLTAGTVPFGAVTGRDGFFTPLGDTANMGDPLDYNSVYHQRLTIAE